MLRKSLAATLILLSLLLIFFKYTNNDKLNNKTVKNEESRSKKSLSTKEFDISNEKEENLKQRFKNIIAKSYEQSISYPKYSIKVIDNESYYLDSNPGYRVSLPISEDGLSISLHLDKYRYFDSDVMKLTITTPITMSQVKISVQDIDSDEILYVDETVSQELSIPVESHWGNELRIIAEVQLEQNNTNMPRDLSSTQEGSYEDLQGAFDFTGPEKITLVADAYHLSSVGQVSHLGTPYPLNEDIIIPIYVTVIKDGFYEILANLKTNNKNITAFLRNRSQLLTGENEIFLKIHHSVLERTQQNYQLFNIRINKLSTSPYEKKEYGKELKNEHDIGVISKDDLIINNHTINSQEENSLSLIKSISK
ncbi:hypothetical protein BS333_16955 [Vibrio azureus]|uniref:Uncharacterized protein n=2 Tax=Vibrio azureus TaxID=512649 RepID=U3AXI5_9VIBR|nr:hypothetical protein [Vibrio azureus]AUI88061.1 hypothetical protein BS333_16955 [Vibrio azureus]GAD77947.1 hypothetical protein VAZ01S_102_00010 [Vibrio azureus NBRC 104587]